MGRNVKQTPTLEGGHLLRVVGEKKEMNKEIELEIEIVVEWQPDIQ